MAVTTDEPSEFDLGMEEIFEKAEAAERDHLNTRASPLLLADCGLDQTDAGLKKFSKHL